MTKKFVEYITKEFIELCYKAQYASPKELSVLLFPNGQICVNFSCLKDSARHYSEIIGILREEMRKSENKELVFKDDIEWLVNSRNVRNHYERLPKLDENGNMRDEYFMSLSRLMSFIQQLFKPYNLK
jgi:hypothetical protein